MIKARQRLDKQIGALVVELVAAGDEEVERLVQVKVVVAVEVAADEAVNLLLGGGMQILKLVQGAELLHIEAVWGDQTGLPLQQVLRLERGDVGDGGEDVRRVGGGALHAVPVVDLAVARLLVQVKLKMGNC